MTDFTIINQEQWNKYKEVNKSEYGDEVMTIATGIAMMLEHRINKSKSKSFDAVYDNVEQILPPVYECIGTTAAIEACAIQALSNTWLYGKELLEWYKENSNGWFNIKEGEE